MRIAYLTDVEGMWGKLASFAEANPDVSLDGDALAVAPGSLLVFGGDAIDRGPDSRRIVATLLASKLRQPGRVILLAGNRDINKIRLLRELGGQPPAKAPDAVRADRPALLRWIFEHTMGARGAFGFRHDELVRERGAAVSDEDVVDGFLDDVRPGGVLARYLGQCQLAFRSGPTLFVHGGLTELSLTTVPLVSSPIDEVDDWAVRLNDFYRAQQDAYQTHAEDPRGYRALIDYQAPSPGLRENPASVVYGRNADALNNPEPPPPAVIARLARASIERVVVGHTPNGDSPSLRRRGRFELHVADNSYSRLGQASQVTLTDDAVEVVAATQLDDGTVARLRYRVARGDVDSPIGKLTIDTGHLVKGATESGDFVLYKALPSYRTEQLAISPAALAARGVRE